MKSYVHFLAVLYIALFGTHRVYAALTEPLTPPESAPRERRVALVIGNSAYAYAPLKNPVNDARAMQAQLRNLGFDVIFRENLKFNEIGGVYHEFRSKIPPGGVALVFYAGHGMQIKGQNYFPAIDSDTKLEDNVPQQSLHLGRLLEIMEEAKAGINLVLLDACRDNPYARRFRNFSRGLAKVETASGTLIHYATKPGSVASDGDGVNGTYTEALLAQINEPGLTVEQVLKRVTNRVVTQTQGDQEPWIEGSLRGEFYFIFPDPATANVLHAPADPETEVWRAAQSSNTVGAYDAYLKEYPKGKYVSAARIKLNALMQPIPRTNPKSSTVVSPSQQTRYQDGTGVQVQRKYSVSKSAKQWLTEAYDIANQAQGLAADDVPGLERVAVKGDARAQTVLAAAYVDGYGIKRSNRQAVKWYGLAASRGYPIAQHELGKMIMGGHGVEHDAKKAVAMFTAAAEQKYPPAQRVLAELYAQGNGVEKDPAKAARWLQESTSYATEDLKQLLEAAGLR